MKSPLSEDQQKKLFEISKLEPEKQQEEFNNFLKTLNKEQIEFLKKQQGGGCPFCAIGKKQIKAFVVYEDELVMGVLDINPANKGHVILFPLEHAESLIDFKNAEHIFDVAKKINEAMIKGLGVKGTNILISNGGVAGQLVPHFAINIIPRSEDDGLSFMWQGKKFGEDEMEEVRKKISGNIKEEIVEEPEEEVKEVYEAIERVP